MSSVDCGLANSHTGPCYSHHRHHTVTASPVPAYVNRSVPTYSITSHEPIAHSHNLASPRYSPNVQPWRRQQPQSSLSFIPSTSPRSEQSEYTTSQPRRPADRGAACISPFRSVRKMKEPFQLRLPTSPSLENNSTSTREPQMTPRPPKIRILRAWRSDQNLMASSLETFGLLPSPPLSDSQNSRTSPSSTYFSSNPGSEVENDLDLEPSFASTTGRRTPHTPATDISAQDRSGGTMNVHMAHSTFVRQCELDNRRFTTATTESGCMSPSEASAADSVGKRNFSGSSAATHRSRSGTASSEASWIPSSLSYCETWLQGAPMEPVGEEAGKSTVLNRRKFQIVQKSPLIPDWKRAHNDAVLAVKSKTKPKLVDISRQSSPAMSCSLSTPTHTIPATPDQSLPEVSAFSPDTPLETPDSGYVTHNPTYSSKGHVDDKRDVHMDSSFVTRRSFKEIDVPNNAAEENDRPKPRQIGDATAIAAPLSEAQGSPGASSSRSERDELERWDHEWTIDQLEHSVQNFPQNILRLTSPVVMFLRHNHERALIRPFRRIFPDAPESLLDSLCAVLIAKNYLLTLPSSSRRTVQLPPRAQFTKLGTVPEKASSVLGMKFAQPPPLRIRDQVLGSRGSKLQQDLDRIVDDLLFTLRGPPDEALKSAALVLIQVLETKA
ncbi:uncharacterized protein BJX67DRAFT_59083 [Aspergillus lucknowensis]|uniref:Uncharacterized protein n=1 Tax=Aspergillus lucknowensis TaxID=176173 RepID=A0ABR4LVD5_9EURO